VTYVTPRIGQSRSNSIKGDCRVFIVIGAMQSEVSALLLEAYMDRFNTLTLTVLFLSLMMLCGCKELVPHDARSLLIPELQRSEIFGFVAGLGTTFAAVPDLLSMLRRRSCAGMNPRMATITGCFQILWVYYGLLIVSRPVVGWNLIGVLINFFSVGAYRHFLKLERTRPQHQVES
jgi:MtN3 and saliva related transmembrane protein